MGLCFKTIHLKWGYVSKPTHLNTLDQTWFWIYHSNPTPWTKHSSALGHSIPGKGVGTGQRILVALCLINKYTQRLEPKESERDTRDSS